MRVCWFSAGVSSFVAAHLTRKTLDRIIYTEIDDQHPDSERFLRDAAAEIGLGLERLKSPYGSVNNAACAIGYVNGSHGAACTNVLKRRERKKWEMLQGKEPLIYVWGFDCTEKDRAERVVELNPQAEHEFPLIDYEITKSDAHGYCAKRGVKRPLMYDLGYGNNNCRCCVKGGMGYFNKCRRDFPELYAARAAMERDVGHTCINGIYLDELDPKAGRDLIEIPMECSIYCEIAAADAGKGENG